MATASNTHLYPNLASPKFQHSEFNCGFCQQLPAGLVESSCCNSLFCWECVASIPVDSKCPNCKESISAGDCKSNIPLKRIVDGMKSKCRLGCSETLSPESRKEHEMFCCPCRLVECPNSVQCGFFMAKDLDQHQQNNCQFRKVPCPQECGNWLSLFEVEEHLVKYCSHSQAECPNACQVNMRRVDLEQHISVCPLQEIQCEFAKHGCTQTVVRSEYEAHLNKSMSKHLSYVSTSLKHQEEELHQLRQQMQERRRPSDSNVAADVEASLKVAGSMLCEAARVIAEQGQGLKQRWDQVSHATLFWILAVCFILYLVPGVKVILFTVLVLCGINKLQKRCANGRHPRRVPKWILGAFIVWFVFHILL